MLLVAFLIYFLFFYFLDYSLLYEMSENIDCPSQFPKTQDNILDIFIFFIYLGNVKIK